MEIGIPMLILFITCSQVLPLIIISIKFSFMFEIFASIKFSYIMELKMPGKLLVNHYGFVVIAPNVYSTSWFCISNFMAQRAQN